MGELIRGLMPEERHWAIREDWKAKYQRLAPQLFRMMENDPAKFAQLALNASEIPSPVSTLGIDALNFPVHTFIKGRPRKAKKNPAAPEGSEPGAYYDDEDEDDYPSSRTKEAPPPYDIINGVAILSIEGPMTLKPTCGMWLFGGTSTIRFRRNLAHAAANPNVGAILIDFHTPGGSVAGTADLADHIARVAQTKIVEGYVANLCASAGYWALSSCRKITVGRSALVGSIGVYMIVEETKKLYDDLGVVIHVFKHGFMKAAGEDGTALDPDQQADFQREIEDLNDEFRVSVMQGRGLTEEQMDAVNTGQVWKGQSLISLRLADAIDTYENVLGRLASEVAAGGLIRFDNAIPGTGGDSPGESSANTTTPVASLPMSGPGSEYPKTDHPVIAAIGSAFERIDAERMALNLENALTTGNNADSETTAEPSGFNPPVPESAPEAEPTVSADSAQAGTEEGGMPEPSAQPSDASPSETITPPEPAATVIPAEETETMNEELQAALTAAGITGANQLQQLVTLAAEGQYARKKALGRIESALNQLHGAGASETMNVADMYGALPLERMEQIAANMEGTWKVMGSHPAQINDPANNPAGARMTEAPGAGVSPAIVNALNASNQNADPTGSGLAPVDPVEMAKKLNADRNERAKTSVSGGGKRV